MSAQRNQKRLMIRWTTLKGKVTVILFLVVAAILEYLVVLYAIGLGVKDTSVLLWSFQFPGTSWPMTITISPLFHLVPVCVVVTLAFSWTYLAKRAALRRQEIRRGKVETFSAKRLEKKGLMSRISRATSNFSKKVKSRLSKAKGIAYLSHRIQATKATTRSALIVLLAFGAFSLMFSLLAYPQLIYRTVSGLYQTNPSLRNFVISVGNLVKGFAGVVAPIGWIGTSINNALVAAAPGFRDFGAGFGSLIGPLAALDDAGKYLVFQNAAAWISVLMVLFYGERVGKGYRYKK